MGRRASQDDYIASHIFIRCFTFMCDFCTVNNQCSLYNLYTVYYIFLPIHVLSHQGPAKKAWTVKAGSHIRHYHINNLNTEKSQPSGDLNPQATCSLGMRHWSHTLTQSVAKCTAISYTVKNIILCMIATSQLAFLGSSWSKNR